MRDQPNQWVLTLKSRNIQRLNITFLFREFANAMHSALSEIRVRTLGIAETVMDESRSIYSEFKREFPSPESIILLNGLAHSADGDIQAFSSSSADILENARNQWKGLSGMNTSFISSGIYQGINLFPSDIDGFLIPK